MFETTKAIIKQNTRSLISKMKESPVLYFVFTVMTILSVLIFAFLTYFLQIIDTKLDISLEDVYFMVIFIFFMKSSVDFYKFFIKSDEVQYPLSTDIKQRRTIFEIFFSILIINLTIWLSFSLLYLLFLTIFRVGIFYPVEYLVFSLGVIVAICLGCTISINFFSPKRYRLIPTFILLGFYYYSREPLFISLTLPLVLLHIGWSIKNAMTSHQYIRRKERINEKVQIKVRSVIKAIFYREITVIWRDKLFYSFVLTSAIVGFGSGYLYVYGDELLIPEALMEFYGGFLPSMFVFMGVFIVVIYTAVFPALNLFLNEENTMWIIRHVPVSNDALIFGKTSALALCFISAIPFIPYISIFMGFDNIVFLTWFLIYSFIACVIISAPLGVKYVGKKSDIMLIYSISMLLFVVLGAGAYIGYIVENMFDYYILVYLFILLIEIFVLYISLKLSSKIYALKYSIRG